MHEIWLAFVLKCNSSFGFLVFTNSLLSGKTFSSVVQIRFGIIKSYLYGRASYFAKQDENIPNPLAGIKEFRSFRSFDSFKHCIARNDKTKDGKLASIAVILMISEMQTPTGLIRLLINNSLIKTRLSWTENNI